MKAKTPDAARLAIESVQEIEAKPTVPKDLIEKIQFNDALHSLIPNLEEILKSAWCDQKPELYAITEQPKSTQCEKRSDEIFLSVELKFKGIRC